MSTKIQENVAILEKLKEPSRYNVVVHDNPMTSFEEVIFILSKCFDKTDEEANNLANKVHLEGKGVCGTYTKEIAEMKIVAVDLAKNYLIDNFPFRSQAIMALKFTLEES